MPKKICGIYKIVSKVHPDRCYIGSAADILNKRWPRHRKNLREQKHNPILQNHYNKYGLDDLVFIIIEECPIDMLIEREQYYLDNDPLNCYFNACKIAGSCTGLRHSEKANKEKSLRQTGKKRKPFSDEHRENLSKSHIGLPFIRRPQHYVKGQESTFKGKHHTEEAIQKNREKHLGTNERARKGAIKRVKEGHMPERDEKGRFIKK